MKKKSFIILLFISMLYFPLLAQENTIYSESQTIRYRMQNQTYGNERDMLSTMARGLNKPINLVRIEIDCRVRNSIVAERGELKLKSEVTTVRVLGDWRYKGFDVSDALLPSKIDFVLAWKNAQNKTIQAFNYREAQFGDGKVLAERKQNNPLQNQQHKLVLENIRFRYMSPDKRALEQKINLISEYENMAQEIENQQRRLNAININNLDKLREYERIVDDVQDFVNQTQRKNFPGVLNLSSHDPEKFNSKFSNLKTRTARVANSLREKIRQLPKIYYDKALDYRSRNRPELAESYFHKSIDANPTYAPSLLELARLEYNRNDWDSAMTRISRLTSTPSQDEYYIDQAVRLGNTIIEGAVANARQWNADRRYDDAIAELKWAAGACRSAQHVDCPPSIDTELANSYRGKYLMMIANAETAIARRDFETARKQIADINSFQQSHSNYIDDYDTEAMIPLYNKLYFAYIETGNELNAQARYHDALELFKQAQQLCSEGYGVECTPELESGALASRNGIYKEIIAQANNAFEQDKLEIAEKLIAEAYAYQRAYELVEQPEAPTLLSKIKNRKYVVCIRDGKVFLDQQNFRAALTKFDEAKKIEGINAFTAVPDPQLTDLSFNAAKGLILQEVKKGEENVRQNQLSNARTFYTKAKTLKEQYLIKNDTEINAALASLNDQIFTQACNNAKQKYDAQYEYAIKLIFEKKFLDAEKQLRQAIQFANDNSQCEISFDNSLAKRQEISQAVDYQQKRVEVQTEIRRQNFQYAIDLYLDAGDYFQQNDISRFELRHPYMTDFINEQKTPFVFFSVGYFLDERQYDKALSALDELQKRDYNKRDTKALQMRLGAQLAQMDFSQNTNSDWKINVLNYTNGNRWFKFLKRAYRRQWRRLD